jgi:hypothetical protein
MENNKTDLVVLTAEHCGVDSIATLINSNENKVKEIWLIKVSASAQNTVNNKSDS